MSDDDGVTKRDGWIICQALATTSELLKIAGLYDQPTDRSDMDAILAARFVPSITERYRREAREQLAHVVKMSTTDAADTES